MCSGSGGGEDWSSRLLSKVFHLSEWTSTPHRYPFAVDGCVLLSSHFAEPHCLKFSSDSCRHKEDRTEDSMERVRMFSPVPGEWRM